MRGRRWWVIVRSILLCGCEAHDYLFARARQAWPSGCPHREGEGMTAMRRLRLRADEPAVRLAAFAAPVSPYNEPCLAASAAPHLLRLVHRRRCVRHHHDDVGAGVLQ